MPHLSAVVLGHESSSCVDDSAWKQAGLVVPPAEVVTMGWKALLQHLREVSSPRLCIEACGQNQFCDVRASLSSILKRVGVTP